MAKRRNNNTKTRTRYVTKAKRYYSRAKSGAKGFGRAIEGAIAGAITPISTKYLGKWGQPAAMLAVGTYTKNDTLQTLGGYSIGVQIGSGLTNTLTGSTDSGTSSGGYY